MPQHTLRLFLIAFILFGCAGLASAQDRIYLNDGTVIAAKVKEINMRTIVYKNFDNQDGPDHVLTRREVEKIVYENGMEERMVNNRRDRFQRHGSGQEDNEGERETLHSQPSRSGLSDQGYGRNILAFAPVQMTFESVAGFGLHYEHMMDKAGMFSLYLPLAFSVYNDNPGYGASQQNRLITSFYPGLKIYPAGSGRLVSYSVGPSLGFSTGSKYQQTRSIDPGTGSVIVSYDEKSFFRTGFLINNGLNIQASKSLYAGIEFGVGVLYYNSEATDYTVGEDPILQFNFKVGYRF